MSPQLIGAAAGAILGLINFIVLWQIAGKAELDPARKKVAGMLKMVAWLDLLAFPVAGYFIGPLVMG